MPGHEVVGRIDQLGADVSGYQVGQRVGVGFLGGSCGSCASCRRGDFVNCSRNPLVGLHLDGGYAEYMVAPAAGLVTIPDELSSVDAAPLLCAGLTTFSAYVGGAGAGGGALVACVADSCLCSLRASPARAGDLVAVQGLGGLGHLAIQFSTRMGFRTVALTRGADKAALAKQLGAHHVIDTAATDAVAALQALGGASVILATASSLASMSPLVAGLRPRGQLLVVGASDEALTVTAPPLLFGMRSIAGHNTGSPADAEDTLRFSSLFAVKPMVQTFPLERAREGFELMMRNEARFRVVLTTGAKQQ